MTSRVRCANCGSEGMSNGMTYCWGCMRDITERYDKLYDDYRHERAEWLLGIDVANDAYDAAARMQDEMIKLEAENKRLRIIIEHYANHDNWSAPRGIGPADYWIGPSTDGYWLAEQALAKESRDIAK